MNQAKIRQIKLNPKRRILITSDLHGNLSLFKELLKKAKYKSDDYLFICGDIINRGQDSIPLLKYVISLTKTNDVFVILGNNDKVLEYIEEENLTFLTHYIKHKKTHSIYYEIFKNYGIELDDDFNIAILQKYQDKIIKDYQEEISFIKQLPLIIETDNFYFAHAGLEEKPLVEQKEEYVLNTDLFYNTDTSFRKMLFVGHYPVTAYRHDISSYQPLIDWKRNITVIDGCYGVKDDGQINMLIFQNEYDTSPSYIALDEMVEALVTNDFNSNDDYQTLIWNQDEVTIVNKDVNFLTCQFNEKTFRIDRDMVYQKDDVFYTYDFTNYPIPLKKGEKVKLQYIYDDICFIKKDSIRGICKKDVLDLNFEMFRKASYIEVRKVANISEEIKKDYKLWDEYYPTYDIFLNDYNDDFLYVYIIKTEVVASVSLEAPITKTPYAISLSRVMVSPLYQRKGICKKMLVNIIDEVRNRGYKVLELLVDTEHPFSLKMYEGAGFVNKGLINTPWNERKYYLMSYNLN